MNTDTFQVGDIVMRLVPLTEETVIKPFESEDGDLNDFLLHDAKNYARSRLSVTYLLETETETVAYFSLSNDKLIKDEESPSMWNKLNRAIANEKRRRSYPAVKIGRLAVSKNHMRSGIGRLILDFVIRMYISNHQRSGCRFITVDAYRKSTSFYEKVNFKYLTNKDMEDATRTMYLDLILFVSSHFPSSPQTV
jgi:predicted GNAT family N-acyltransferase